MFKRISVGAGRMKCLHCKSSALGEVLAKENGVLHKNCTKAYEAGLRGLVYICPQCESSGEMKDPSGKTVKQRVNVAKGKVPLCAYDGCRGCEDCRTLTQLVDVPARITCDLCKGEGFCNQKATPLMGVIGWTFD